MKKNMRTLNALPKIKAGLTILVMMLAFFIANTAYVKATPVSEVASVPQTITEVKKTLGEKILKVLKTFGSKLVSSTLRSTLNRVAIDAAKFAGSAGEGQKPQYIVEPLGGYIKNLGDAAAGDFIDEVGKNWQVDLCQPPNPTLRAKIGLGLTQAQAPTAPNCTVSNLVSNYKSEYEKYASMKSGDYLKAVQVNFEPGGSELGAAFELFGRTTDEIKNKEGDALASAQVSQGWIDVRGIDGKLKGVPGDAKDTLANAKALQSQGILSFTGDALVDAANIFLNQLAYEGVQRGIRELNKLKNTSSTSDSSGGNNNPESTGPQYSASSVAEKLATFIKSRFDVRSDYSILSDLAICTDQENPGPNNCVIDDKFSQAISEKLTVKEALAGGYLHGDWLVSGSNTSDSTYTLRSAIILRKFRIVPVGWEQAISIAAANNYQATFQDLVSCFDGNGPFSSNFDQNNKAWCTGLVDPNWVLKAPLNYCSKQGAGNQIVSSFITKDENGLSALAISRANEYCADEQTCIKEKSDGSCEVYGYCNEEKRIWKFSSDTCEPVYNTCQTFSDSANKKTVSFLENTLDFSTCDSSNSGCKQYVYGGTYSTSTQQVSWDKRYSIFLNNQAKNCNNTTEGCTNLLRGKPGWQDVNYIMDPEFKANNIGDTSTSTNWHWPIRTGLGTIIDGKALKVTGITWATLYSDNTNSLLPKNLTALPGWSYTLSAEVKIDAGDKVAMTFGSDNKLVELSDKNVWKTIAVTILSSEVTNNLNFALTGSGSQVSFSVRNLNLEPNDPSDLLSSYSSYGAFPIYEKLLPNYLESACYTSVSGTGDYRLKAGAPDVCNKFARKCNREEVGCEQFTSVKDSFVVAAKANEADYCDAKCDGYDTYLAKASYFYGTSADNLIPDTSKSCSAESVGCASFTNLDAATQGGEQLEYYAKVRQCIKPHTASFRDF